MTFTRCYSLFTEGVTMYAVARCTNKDGILLVYRTHDNHVVAECGDVAQADLIVAALNERATVEAEARREAREARVRVETEKYFTDRGWVEQDTGGGCRVFEYALGYDSLRDIKYHVWVSVDADLPTRMDEKMLVGFYTLCEKEGDGDQVVFMLEVGSAQSAVGVAAMMRNAFLCGRIV